MVFLVVSPYLAQSPVFPYSVADRCLSALGDLDLFLILLAVCPWLWLALFAVPLARQTLTFVRAASFPHLYPRVRTAVPPTKTRCRSAEAEVYQTNYPASLSTFEGVAIASSFCFPVVLVGRDFPSLSPDPPPLILLPRYS